MRPLESNEAMVKITDLEWKDHPSKRGGEQATHVFANGYEASCLRGGPFYTSNGTFEIAVMRDGHLDYTTSITDDVLGHLTEQEANDALAAIEALPLPGK